MRPDLNGIEYFWADMKKAYRKEVMRGKVQARPFNNFDLVSSAYQQTPNRSAQRACYQGLANLINSPEVVEHDAAD